MIDLLSLFPDDLKRQLLDGLIGGLADLGKRLAGEKASEQIRRLSSESSFLRAFDQALERGLKRFQEEYIQEDEDLTLLLTRDPSLWRSSTVRQALREMVRRPGTPLPQERQKLLDSFHDVLPERINRERVDRAVFRLLSYIAEELWNLPAAREVREAYALQFQRITAEEARRQSALIQAQLQALSDLREDIRNALLQLTDGLTRQALAAASVPALPVRQRPYHNLPQPDYTRFVGREKEREWLRQRLSPQDRAWVIILSGIGGVGKTALALATAHEYLRQYDELPPEERFDAIVWASAKEEVLTTMGAEQAAPTGLVARTLADIYAAIAQVLEREAITRAATRAEQDRLVQQALTAQRTLLVLDNLDTLEGPGAEEVRAFLRNLPPPTKAIVTSRERLDVADVLPLQGMEENEARQLMETESQARSVHLEAAQQAELYRRTAGLPLPIKLSIARLAAGETWEGVRRWLGDASSDLVRYCVGGQVELARRRSPEAYRLLLACSLFDRDAGAAREALGTIADLPLRDRDEGLALLLRLSLVNRTPESDRFWLLPLVQEYARAELAADPSLENQFLESWILWYQDLLRTYPSGDYATLRRELPNIILAFRWLLFQNKTEALAEASRWGVPLLYAEGEWKDCLTVCQYLAEQALAKSTPELLSLSLLTRYVDLMMHQDRGDEFRSQWSKLAPLFQGREDWEAIRWGIQARLARWETLYEGKPLLLAIQFIEYAIERVSQMSQAYNEILLITLNSLGLLYLYSGDPKRATQVFTKCLEILPKCTEIVASEWEAILRGNIAIAKGRQGKYAEAKEEMYRALPYLREKIDLAEVRLLLAVYEYHLGNVATALELGRQADRLLEELGVREPPWKEFEYQEWLTIKATVEKEPGTL
jgi:tetratricopeptide (TPR) repeat protein